MNPPVRVDEVLAALRATLPDLLVALDFDGTLAPLVPDPADSRPVPGTIDALARLAHAGAQVAIVTGRDARTVVRLGGLAQIPDVVVAGLYGIETWHGGELASPATPPELTALQDRLPEVLRDHNADPAVWIEDKRLSLVVHARKADDPTAALTPLRQPVADLCADLGLEMHAGNDVLELRLPGYDKAGALDRLVGDHAGVLFVGDDLGDVPALEHVRAMRANGRQAWGIAVRSSGVAAVAEAADYSVAGPDDVVALLDALAGR